MNVSRLSVRHTVFGGSILACLACLLLGGCESMQAAMKGSKSLAEATPTDGLREALRVATDRAVGELGQQNGYLDNDFVRLVFPDQLEPLEKGLRLIGAGEQVDEFKVSMNRAAEAAAPLAGPVFADAVSEMTFDDAVKILKGDKHEATDYLRAHAGPKLKALFRPIIEKKLDSVGTTRELNELIGLADRIPFYDKPAFSLTDYVTDQALDGLFKMIGKEERKIREDPIARTTELLRKYFG